jgi:hypothetical protein
MFWGLKVFLSATTLEGEEGTFVIQNLSEILFRLWNEISLVKAFHKSKFEKNIIKFVISSPFEI